MMLLKLKVFLLLFFFFFQAEDGIRDKLVTGVQTCALPISPQFEPGGLWLHRCAIVRSRSGTHGIFPDCLRDALSLRSEEHTSELQSLAYLVCRLLLEKKNKTQRITSN